MSEIFVEIIATKGSTPRDTGTVMRVKPDIIEGTIGGGALEYQAISHARRMLAENAADTTRHFALGPGLGQCCGGSVKLFFTRQTRTADQDRFIAPSPRRASDPQPLWVWGAGHVGRAVVRHAAAIGAFNITWIDTAQDRYPAEIPAGVCITPAARMPLLVPHAPPDARHLILTYSHDIDFELCAALLRHEFGFCGLIGSATKRARFASRLKALNLDATAITCPIGDKRLGKHPDDIAAGTLRDLLARQPRKETA